MPIFVLTSLFREAHNNAAIPLNPIQIWVSLISLYGAQDELQGYATISPCINQIEFSPIVYQHEVKEYCDANNITTMGYSPFGMCWLAMYRPESSQVAKARLLVRRYCSTMLALKLMSPASLSSLASRSHMALPIC